MHRPDEDVVFERHWLSAKWRWAMLWIAAALGVANVAVDLSFSFSLATWGLRVPMILGVLAVLWARTVRGGIRRRGAVFTPFVSLGFRVVDARLARSGEVVVLAWGPLRLDVSDPVSALDQSRRGNEPGVGVPEAVRRPKERVEAG